MSLMFKAVTGGLSVLVLILLLMLTLEKRHSEKLQGQLTKATAELHRISTERDEQRRESERNIAQANEKIVYVDRVVTKLESRPLPGNCQTPDADEWRNVL